MVADINIKPFPFQEDAVSYLLDTTTDSNKKSTIVVNTPKIT